MFKEAIVKELLVDPKKQSSYEFTNLTFSDLNHISSLNKLKAFSSLDKLTQTGFFQPVENSLSLFNFVPIYSIKFNIKEFDLDNLTLWYNYEEDNLNITGFGRADNDLNYNNFKLDEFIVKAKMRFITYDFTPENGWGFMNYLDLMTSQKLVWDEIMIKSIDNLISQGFKLNAILPLIIIGVAPEHLESSLGVPLPWVKKAHNYKPVPIFWLVDEYEPWAITKNSPPLAPRTDLLSPIIKNKGNTK
jgi:hypothetical protein